MEGQSGVAWVTVKDQRDALNEKGNFQADILPKVGKNDIVVDAMDVRSNHASQRFSIVREAERMKAAKRNITSCQERQGTQLCADHWDQPL